MKTPKRFPTKNQMRDLRECIANSHNLASLTDQKVYISWSPQMSGRAYRWADKKFGKREWVRDPFGSYQDPQALERVWALVREKEAQK